VTKGRKEIKAEPLFVFALASAIRRLGPKKLVVNRPKRGPEFVGSGEDDKMLGGIQKKEEEYI
jgi:hypothetical protein